MVAKKKAPVKKPKIEDFEGTLETALKISQGLGWLANREMKNGKLALRIGRMSEKFGAEVKVFNDRRIELIKELGYQPEEEDEDGNVEKQDWKVKDENLEEFEERLTEMRDEPVKIVGVVKIDFADIERSGIPPVLMVALDPIMTGQED